MNGRKSPPTTSTQHDTPAFLFAACVWSSLVLRACRRQKASARTTNGSRNAKCTSSCCFSLRGVSGGGTRPTVCRFSAQRSSHQTHTRVVLSLWQPAHVATDVPVIAFIIHDMCVCYQRGWLHTHTRQAAAYNFSPNCTQKIQFKFHPNTHTHTDSVVQHRLIASEFLENSHAAEYWLR